MPRHESCPLLLQVYDDHICPLYLFYWNRSCWCLLLKLLPFRPNLRLKKSLLLCTSSCWYICPLNWSSCFLSPSQLFFLLPTLPLMSIYYSLIPLFYTCGRCSDFINLLLITPFIPFLNFFTNSLFLYPLFFTTIQNSYTNSSIVLPPYSIFFNSTTFMICLLLQTSFLN